MQLSKFIFTLKLIKALIRYTKENGSIISFSFPYLHANT